MKRILPLLALAAALCSFMSSARGASVLWNEEFVVSRMTIWAEDGTVWGWGLSIDTMWEGEDFNEEGVYMELGMEIGKSADGSRRSLFGVLCDVANAWWVVVSEVGDEVNSETSKNPSRLFYTNTGSHSDFVRLEYTDDNPLSLFLGLALKRDVTPNEVYGWVELIVDNDEIRLGDTCLDLTGRPVVVGVRSAEPIPEPASGALALVGAALLFRRRPLSTLPRAAGGDARRLVLRHPGALPGF